MNYKGYSISAFTIALGAYFFVVILGVVDAFSMGSFLKYFALLPIVLSISSIRQVKLDKRLTPLFVYHIFAILSVVWSINFEESLVTVTSFASFILLVLAICSHKYNEGENNFLKESLAWSSRLSLLVTWVFAYYDSGRLFLHGTLLNEDPNYLCAYFYFGIALSLTKILEGNSLKGKVLNGIEALAYLYTIFATGSRGGLFGAIVVALVIFIKSNPNFNISSFLPKLILVGVMIVVLPRMMGSMDDNLMSRFSIESILESDGSGRYEIWEDALRTFENSDVFHVICGYGMGASRTVAAYFSFTRVNVMHNVFLEVLIGLGLIGLIIYCIYLFNIYVLSKSSYFATAVLMGMIVLSLSTSILYLKPYWNVILFIVMLTKLNKPDDCY